MSSRLRITGLLAAIALLGAAIAIAAPADTPLVGAATADAATCKGADRGPRRISHNRAGRLVLCLVNKKRRKHGMNNLRSRRSLKKAASRHSRRMRKTGCFSHTCPGERDMVSRATRSGYLPCGCNWGVGETIAWGPKGRGSPRRIVKSWMHSPGHRAQLLNRSFQHAGVGVRWGAPGSRGAKAGIYTMDLGFKR